MLAADRTKVPEKLKEELEKLGFEAESLIREARLELMELPLPNSENGIKPREFIELLEEKYDNAASKGFSGLRASLGLKEQGSPIQEFAKKALKIFEDPGSGKKYGRKYGRKYGKKFGEKSEKNIVLLITAPSETVSFSDALDLAASEVETLIKRDGNWTTLKQLAGERKQLEGMPENAGNPEVEHPAGGKNESTGKLGERTGQSATDTKFRTIFDSSNDGIIIYDLEGRILEANRVACQRVGYSREELLGRSIEDIKKPGQQDIKTQNGMLLERGNAIFESETLCRDGSIIPHEVSNRLIDYEGKKAVLSIARDISERKNAFEALKNSEKKFRTIFDSSNDGAVIFDLEGKILEINKISCERMGYAREEMLKMSILDFTSIKDETGVDGQLEKLKQTGTSVFEIECVRKDGTAVPREISNRLIEYEGKKAILSIARDITERKKVFETLKKSEKKFRTIFDSSNDAVTICSLDGKILEVNQVTCNRTGYTREELLQNSVEIFAAGEHLSRINEKKEEILQKGFCVFETETVCKNGDIIPHEVNNRLIDYEGETAVLTIGRDISERKKTRKSLLESEKKYRMLFEESPLGIFHVNREGVVTLCNESMAKIAGSSREEIIGLDLKSALKDSSMKKAFETAMSKEKGNYEGEYTSITGNRTVPLKTTYKPLVSEEGAFEGCIGIMEDISESKRVEALQFEKALFLQKLVNSIPAPVYYKDKNGAYLGCNRAFEAFLGKKKEEIIGKTVHAFFPEEIADSYYSMDMELIRQRGNQVFETPIKYADGSYHQVVFNKVVFRGMSQDDSVLLGIIWDISERKSLEEELIRARKDAEFASMAKSEFITNMSHELRTPLNSVIGFSDLLLSEAFGPLNSKQGKYITNILKSGKHLLEIVNNLLDISRLETGDEELQYENVFLEPLMDEIRAVLYPLAANKHITLESRCDSLLQSVEADRTKLKQVLYNLLSNAIKFTPEKGKISVNSKKKGEMVEISIKDTGIGIPEESLEKIFQPFVQADSSTSREYGGTGLGLHIVKSFVELHGGEVWVESEYGKGSTFTFTLPIKTRNKSSSEKRKKAKRDPCGMGLFGGTKS